MEKIAFIGLGIMGRPMAQNLLKAGHSLSLWARRPAALDGFDGPAVSVCGSPADAVAAADFCITMVSDTADVEEVILGPDGVIHKAAAGSIVIDMSTISATITRGIAAQLAARQVQMLDAPVSGGEQGAVAGTLSIMVGGDEDAFARARPLLETLGDKIVHVGGHGAGQIAKACNQLLVAQTIGATAEALEFAQAAGVDPRRVREALLGGFANSKILEIHGHKMLEQNYTPGFKARLHLKDLNIAEDVARAMGLNLAGLKLARENLRQLVATGGGELDSAAIAKVVRTKARK